jgi:putative nucleotidyltransferase with HDIG domain
MSIHTSSPSTSRSTTHARSFASTDPLADLFGSSVDVLLDQLAVHHPPTYDHCRRVASLARQLATSQGFSSHEVAVAFSAGLLHDIGHLGTPRDILGKREPLSDDEWAVVRRHPELGAALLRNCGLDPRVAACAATHHEQPDGRGYPRAEHDLEPLCALVTVASVFDTLTYKRWLERAQPQDDALRELRRAAGTQLDASAVRALHTLLAEP